MAQPTRSDVWLRPTLKSWTHQTDTLLQHSSRLLSTAAGIDNTLSTLLFASALARSQLTRLLTKRYERLALAVASKASQSLQPGEAVLATIETPESRLARVCEGLKALKESSGEVWMFLRLFGLFHIYRGAREAWDKPSRDPSIRVLVWGQVVMNATFQIIENVAFLASKNIIPPREGQNRSWPWWMAVSNRLWMVAMLLEALRLLRVRQLRYNEELGAQQEDDEKTVKVQSKELEQQWSRQFYATAGWLPMTLHWSFEDESDSPITEMWQGVCGLVPSLIGLQDVWRETA